MDAEESKKRPSTGPKTKVKSKFRTIKHKKKRKGKGGPKPVKLKLNEYRHQESIEGTPYVMEYVFSKDQLFKFRRGKYKDLYREPKIEIVPTKCSEMRDEFSAYCGTRKTIKNWLFYV